MKGMTVMLKRIIAPLLLVAFLLVAFFSFAAMSYAPDGSMQGGCPFSTAGTPLCPQDALAVVMHHVSSYQSFFNVLVGSGFSALIIALCMAAIALALLATRTFIPTAPVRVWYESPPAVSYNKKLTRWLSLFEHSPSL